MLWQRILEGKPVLLGYLWYVPIMLLAFALIYTFRMIIKSNIAFVILLALVCAVAFLILYIPISQKLGVARGIGAVSFGVLLSFIPKAKMKIKQINFNAVITVAVFAVVVYLAFLPKNDLICEYLLVFLFMPMLIYFANTIKVNSKFLNFLGSLSFALYAYQCVVRVIRMLAPIPQYWFFIILVCLVAIDKLAHVIYKRYKSSQKVVMPA